MGVVGWLAIGCLVVLLLGLGSCFACGYYAKRKLGQFSEEMQKNPEMAAAKLVVQMTPDLELVSTDEEAGTLTVKNTKTGETVTVSVADAKEGKFSLTTDEGTTSVDASAAEGSLKVTDAEGNTATYSAGGTAALPSWLPAYPNGTASTNYQAETGDGKTAMVMITTSDSIEDVVAFYERELGNAGLEVQKSVMTSGGSTSGGTVSGQTADEKRIVAIVVGVSDGQTQVSLTWTEKP
jgi:hypothetical protein